MTPPRRGLASVSAGYVVWLADVVDAVRRSVLCVEGGDGSAVLPEIGRRWGGYERAEPLMGHSGAPRGPQGRLHRRCPDRYPSGPAPRPAGVGETVHAPCRRQRMGQSRTSTPSLGRRGGISRTTPPCHDPPCRPRHPHQRPDVRSEVQPPHEHERRQPRRGNELSDARSNTKWIPDVERSTRERCHDRYGWRNCREPRELPVPQSPSPGAARVVGAQKAHAREQTRPPARPHRDESRRCATVADRWRAPSRRGSTRARCSP